MRSIVVSVCAKTAEELVKQIKQAEEFGDVIEVRFDCLGEDEFDTAIEKLALMKSEKPLLATFRPKNEHSYFTPGKVIYRSDEERELHFKYSPERFQGWLKILSLERVLFADFERDILNVLFADALMLEFGANDPEEKKEVAAGRLIEKIAGKTLIFSEHFFNSCPPNIETTFSDLASESLKNEEDLSEEFEIFLQASVKIAVQTDEISEGLQLWNLLKKAKSENRQLIPIAMGNAGKWTRILGLAYSAPMTYASLETGKEVAPGQISAEDLRDVYRVKELNEQTEIYGVIGDPVTYSLSPYMQNAGFKGAGLNAVFIPFEVKDLESFIKRFLPESGLNIRGLSVTIPHKQSIMKYLDEIDETAQKIGAVNTVKIAGGKLYGYNTDAPGFIAPLKKTYGDLKDKKAAILGAGGAARAVIYALQREGAKVTIFARDPAKAKALAEEFKIALKNLQDADRKGFDIVINATPLGMKGKFEGQSASTSSQLKGVSVAYDLVYNPEITPFMDAARTAGAPVVIGGAEMLVAQGVEQFKIWTGNNAPEEIMFEAVRKKLR